MLAFRNSAALSDLKGCGEGRSEMKEQDVDRHIGARIRRVRRFMGWTQSELASTIGVSYQQIQRYEAGGDRIYSARVRAVPQANGAPVEYFFDGLAVESGPASPGAADRGRSPRSDSVIDVVTLFFSLGDAARRRLLKMASALEPAA